MSKSWVACLMLAMLVTGCGNVSRVIVTPLGDPVLLTSPIEGPLDVLVADDGKWVQGRVDQIPAGFACLAPEKSDFE